MCGCCRRQHNTLPLNLACKTPDHWLRIPETERDIRGRMDSDVCIFHGKDIFISGGHALTPVACASVRFEFFDIDDVDLAARLAEEAMRDAVVVRYQPAIVLFLVMARGVSLKCCPDPMS